MKWWILAVLIVVGLMSWCWLNLTPAARRKRAMPNRRPRNRTNWKDLRLTSRARSSEPVRKIPSPPKTPADYMDVG